MLFGKGDEFIDRRHARRRIRIYFIDDIGGAHDARLVSGDQIDQIARRHGGQIHYRRIVRLRIEDDLFENRVFGIRLRKPIDHRFGQIARCQVDHNRFVECANRFGHGTANFGIRFKRKLIP